MSSYNYSLNSNACRIILPSADINSSITSSAILVSEFRKENRTYLTPSTPKQQTLLSFLLLLVCFAQWRQEQQSTKKSHYLPVYKCLHSLKDATSERHNERSHNECCFKLNSLNWKKKKHNKNTKTKQNNSTCTFQIISKYNVIHNFLKLIGWENKLKSKL